jgi:cytosine deaminase
MKVPQELQKGLDTYKLNKDCQDDRLGYRCCELALAALENGCYGVGAVLFDNRGQILAEGRNKVFQNGFFSDRHAEMIVLNLFEEQFPVYGDRSQLTMLVSLEPCPMCFTRLLLAGIGRVIYLAEDRDGGMVHRLDQMPDVWRNLAQLQTRHQADVTPTLSSLAARLANCQLDQLRHKLLKAIRT